MFFFSPGAAGGKMKNIHPYIIIISQITGFSNVKGFRPVLFTAKKKYEIIFPILHLRLSVYRIFFLIIFFNVKWVP